MKNKKCILLGFFFISFISLYAQDTWIHTYQPFGDVYYYPEDIVVCQDSGYAINGYYYYDSGPYPIEEEWGFLIKTDSNGNLLWSALDIQNDWPISRSWAFSETLNGDFIIAGCGYLNVNHLIKRDSDGNLLWILPSDLRILSMELLNDGNIILAGRNSNNTLSIRKIDVNGNVIWTNNYNLGDSMSFAMSIIQTADDGFALTGKVYYDGNTYSKMFVMKTDSLGDSLWTKTFSGENTYNCGFSITQDNNDNLMASGNSNIPNYCGLLIYLDIDGNIIWEIETDYHIRTILSVSENSFVAGSSNFYSFDNKYEILWSTDYPGGGLGDKGIAFINENGFVFPYFNNNSLILYKTNNEGGIVSIDDTEILQFENQQLFNYPNPFNPSTTIEFSIKNNSRVELSVYNIKGQKVKILANNEFEKGNHSIIWNGDNDFRKQVSSGIYYYKLTINGKNEVVKKCLLLK